MDPFQILRSVHGDPAPAAIVTPESDPDLFAGSEPINAADPVVASAATPTIPAGESVLEAAILAMHDRITTLEIIARRNGWSL